MPIQVPRAWAIFLCNDIKTIPGRLKRNFAVLVLNAAAPFPKDPMPITGRHPEKCFVHPAERQITVNFWRAPRMKNSTRISMVTINLQLWILPFKHLFCPLRMSSRLWTPCSGSSILTWMMVLWQIIHISWN